MSATIDTPQIQPENNAKVSKKEPAKKLSKNQWRRKKLKEKKQTKKNDVESADEPKIKVENHDVGDGSQYEMRNKMNIPTNSGSKMFESDVDVALNDPQFAVYKQILDKFHTESTETTSAKADDIFYSDDENNVGSDDNEETESQPISKKKRKNKMQLAELKAIAPRPELIDWFDADAPDPLLVVEIKSHRGVVPVPEHWQLKREYLSSKRGIKKAPFELPGYIKDTGIMEMRNVTKEDDQTLKQMVRERVQPKMGKLDIDYEKLYNAFFKFQTKPRLYKFGELYYEGKETEMNVEHFRPGKLSPRLIEALNIPPNAPPPWLVNMQRYGPPPSYPGLRIPGLNAPIPPGAQWGFQPGGYGRAPLDENGQPLYGDVYATTNDNEKSSLGVPIERNKWGQLILEESEEEEEEDEDEDDDKMELEDDEGAGYVDEETAINKDKLKASDETPEIELRKTIPQSSKPEKFEEPRDLFKVLKEKTSSNTGFMGHQKTYEF